MIRRATILALLLGARIVVAQSPVIEVRDAGPGPGPALLEQELARPYAVVAPAATRFVLRRDTVVRRTLVVLGRDTYVEGRVDGDLVVIGGDLYLHPGGAVQGRAIAIGGAVYESALATTGTISAFRDFTYDITPTSSGYALTYRSLVAGDSTALLWPGFFGLHLPTYDRTNGLSLGFGPSYHVQNTGITVEPRITYRSQLGKWDPAIDATDSIGRRTAIRLVAERTTASNERWIWPDLVNSLSFLAAGSDMRQYYRATRVEATASRRWESVNGALSPYVGALYETTESARPGPNATGGPWVLFDRRDSDDVLRPNPLVPSSRIVSAIAGAAWDWTENNVAAQVNGRVELGSPTLTCGCLIAEPAGFGQATIDGRVEFPTFGTQSFTFHGHGVATDGGDIPVQRDVFLGGPGTLPTLEPMSLAGTDLLYLDFRYNIPIDLVTLPMVGPPTLSLREILGGATFNERMTLHQAIGVRASASYLYGEALFDSSARHFHLGLGLSATP